MPPLLTPPINQEREALPVLIDQEWVASLVGLCMRVAAGFVPGCKGEEEYIARKIARIDVDDGVALCQQTTGQLPCLQPPFFPSMRSISRGGNLFSGGRVAVKEVGCADDVLAEEGSADDVVVEEEGSADAPEEPCLPAAIGPKVYSLTKSMDWTVLKNGQPGRPVAPVPYTGGDELFSVKMEFDKVKGMMDANGELRYSRIFDD